MIKQRRVITDKYDVRTDVKTIICEEDSNIIKGVAQYLRKYSPMYSNYIKQLDAWKHYAELSNDASPYYIVGKKRETNMICLLIN